jgi:hypothetical protein
MRSSILISAVLLASTAFAHLPIKSTIKGALVLTEQELRHEISTAHFLLPPTQTLGDQTDTNKLSQAIAAHLAEHHPLTIDGIRVPPTIKTLSLENITNAVYLDITTNYTRVTLSVVYPVNQPPKQIGLVWKLFPTEPASGWSGIIDEDQDPYQIIQTFSVYGEISFLFFAPSEPEFIWHADTGDTTTPIDESRQRLTIPLASILLCLIAGLYFTASKHRNQAPLVRLVLIAILLAAATLSLSRLTISVPAPGYSLRQPTESEALSIFAKLHANIYRAFEYDTEEEIYDVLAQSVDGALLVDLYSQIYKSLILRYKGGAVCTVTKVDILESSLVSQKHGWSAEKQQIILDCRWRVHGVVEHWEHLHRRVNEYQARFTLSPSRGRWKLKSVDITNQERVTAEDRPTEPKLTGNR